MVQAHDHVGCETCLDALIDLEARVDALEQPDRARRRDEAYRAMVEALERWQTISDRLGVPDAMWDSGEWAIVRQQGRDALALARQVEEA